MMNLCSIAAIQLSLRYLANLQWSVLIGGVTIFVAILSGLATFLVLTGRTSIPPTYNVVVIVLVGNLVLVFFLSLLIMIELLRLVQAWRSGDAGARLQGQFVSLFAFVATTPAIIVAIVASVTLDTGLDRWFTGRARSMIQSSTMIAYAYMRERTNEIRSDLLAMIRDLDKIQPLINRDKDRFSEIVRERMEQYALGGVYIINGRYRIILKHTRTAHDLFLIPPFFALQRAKEGESVILTPGINDQANEIGVLTKLQNYQDSYLYIVRRLDAKVVQHVRETAAQAMEYQDIAKNRYSIQIAFALMYINIALILMFSAIWMALWFSRRLVAPIRRLINAARLVSRGDLGVQVPISQSDGELANLGMTFNSMTSQLKAQRDELLKTNDVLDNRRRFTEAVLASVTSGVIGIDRNGNVEFINRSAETFWELNANNLIGRPLEKEISELCKVLQAALKLKQTFYQEQIVLYRKAGREHTVDVRVTSKSDQSGYVVTIDDITELVTAQRATAWRDIARRIAHEIKNPLTPIQLSAERLRRKYSTSIQGDQDVFDRCVETIIRQVGDIGRMVDEFSAFARMPKAVMKEVDLIVIVRQAVFLIGVSVPEIKIEIIHDDSEVRCICDRRLISQMITNLVKNAIQAISSTQYRREETPWIEVHIKANESHVTLLFTDNGCGLPQENRQQLFEPYVTKHDKGTGLGLAIVRKIVEEHCGEMMLCDSLRILGGRSDFGAQIKVIFLRWLDGSGNEKA
ncbi:MAG: PAS domain-containing sensor histidine kinase [Alphaproteobacteria bacterium]|nr:PAS domain-containing sensor histidine kinase [Alphaproteobacteria bacterium]